MNKVRFVLKCFIVIMIPFIFNYCFVSDINVYTRIMLDELRNDGHKDVLFLGPSTTYRSYDVALIEERTGLNVFNGGSSAQQLQGSYFMLKEAVAYGGVGTVWLDMPYHVQSQEGPGKKQTYIITDYMQDISSKDEYLYEAFGAEGIINDVLPFLHGFKLTPTTLKEHITRNYLQNSYDYVTYDNEAYYGQGFVYSYKRVDNDYEFNKGAEIINPENLISDFSMKWLLKIIDYCKINNIQLFLVIPPMPDGRLTSIGNYQLYVEAVREIAITNNIEYWDFNLIKKDVMTMTRMDFADKSHLNGEGADKFSECVSKILNNEVVDPFYDTYLEKLQYNPDNTIIKSSK